jgi:hypothetical protein
MSRALQQPSKRVSDVRRSSSDRTLTILPFLCQLISRLLRQSKQPAVSRALFTADPAQHAHGVSVCHDRALGVFSPALGQSRVVSALFGYQHLSVDQADADGVFADLAVSIAGPFAIVGAVDWARQRSQVFGFDQSLVWLASSEGMRVGLGAAVLFRMG